MSDGDGAAGEGAGGRDEIVEAMVHDPQPAMLGQFLRELSEPRMAGALVGEHVLEDAGALAALLRRAQHGLGHLRPAAHHPEAVAHGQERRIGGGADAVEQREQRSLPRRIFLDALRAVGVPVVAVRVDVAGSAGAEVDRETAAGPLRDHVAPPHLERDGADTQPHRVQHGGEVAGGVLDGVHEGVVAQVRIPVVHVEDRDVDHPLVGRGYVARGLHAHVFVTVGGAEGRTLLEAVFLTVGPLELAGVASGTEDQPRG
jgi:hypothetical protein